MNRLLPALATTLLLAACGEDSITLDLHPGETLTAQLDTLRLHVPPEGATLYLCPADDGHSAPSPTHDIRDGWGTFTDWAAGVHEIDVDPLGASQAWLVLGGQPGLDEMLKRAIEDARRQGRPGMAAALAHDLELRSRAPKHPWRDWAKEGATEIPGAVELLRIAFVENDAGQWDRSEDSFRLAGECEALPVHLQAMRLSWLGDLLAHRLDVSALSKIHRQLEPLLPQLSTDQRWAREIELLNQRNLTGDRIDALARIDGLADEDVPPWAAPKLSCIRGFLLEESGQLELALAAMESALANCNVDDRFGNTINKGRILRLLGRHGDALRLFEAASSLPQADQWASVIAVARGYAVLEQAIAEGTDPEIARIDLESAWAAFQQLPPRPDYYLPFLEPLSMLELEAGRVQAARAYMETAQQTIRSTRADPELLRARFGRWGRLEQTLSRLEREHGSPSPWPGLARALAWKAGAGAREALDGPGLLARRKHAQQRLKRGPPLGLSIAPPASPLQARDLPWLAVDLCFGERRLFAYVLDGAGHLTVHDLAPAAEVQDQIQTLEDLLAARVLDAAQFTGKAAAMTETWLAPILKDRPPIGGLLVSAPAEFERTHLGALPYQAAESPSSFDEVAFLADSIQVIYLPSLLPLFAAPSASQHRQAQPFALVVGNPASPHAPRLPGSESEARKVASALRKRGFEVDLLLGEAATLEAVLTALPKCSVIHLATHAIQSVDRPSRSGILLTPGDSGDRLTIAHLQDLDLPSPQVVLSACATADGPSLATGSASLPAAFLAAGATSVVASTQAVGDASASAWALAWHGGPSPPKPAEAPDEHLRSPDASAPIITRARDPRHWGRWKVYWSGTGVREQ